MTIVRLTPESAAWPAFLEHARRENAARWILDEAGQPLDALYCLAALDAEVVIGHLTLRRQPITSPASPTPTRPRLIAHGFQPPFPFALYSCAYSCSTALVSRRLCTIRNTV